MFIDALLGPERDDSPPEAHDDEPLDAYSRAVTGVAERLGPSVANLRVSRRVRGGRVVAAAEGGSGVVVTPDGFLLTSAHVVAAASGGIRASFVDGRECVVSVVGTDPLSDMAVLRVEGSQTWCPPSLATRSDCVGQLVVAIGNPHGFESSATPTSFTGRCHRHKRAEGRIAENGQPGDRRRNNPATRRARRGRVAAAQHRRRRSRPRTGGADQRHNAEDHRRAHDGWPRPPLVSRHRLRRAPSAQARARARARAVRRGRRGGRGQPGRHGRRSAGVTSSSSSTACPSNASDDPQRLMVGELIRRSVKVTPLCAKAEPSPSSSSRSSQSSRPSAGRCCSCSRSSNTRQRKRNRESPEDSERVHREAER